MELVELFKDEALVEILEFADLSIIHEDNHTRIYVKPFEKNEITKIQMEVVLDFFKDYNVSLNLIDDPLFVIEDIERLEMIF